MVSFLRRWAEAHGMDRETCYRQSGIDDSTFSWLWSGSKTIPSMALTIGKNLGMAPDEVRQLGVTLDAELWTGHIGDERKERFTHDDWPKLLDGWNPAPVMFRIGTLSERIQRQAPQTLTCQRCGIQFSISMGHHGGLNRKYCSACVADRGEKPSREIGARGEYRCECCGRLYMPSRIDQRYCSETCRVKQKYQRQKQRSSNEPVEKVCPHCGKTFWATQQIYCSEECKTAARSARRRDGELAIIDRECLVCGKRFWTVQIGRVYCGPLCNTKASQFRRQYGYNIWEAQDREMPQPGGRAKERTCMICGTVFQPKNGTQRCCSPECSAIRNREYNRKYHEEHVDKKQYTPRPKICPECGKEFMKTLNAQKYCSAECAGAVAARQKSVSNKRRRKHDGKAVS